MTQGVSKPILYSHCWCSPSAHPAAQKRVCFACSSFFCHPEKAADIPSALIAGWTHCTATTAQRPWSPPGQPQAMCPAMWQLRTHTTCPPRACRTSMHGHTLAGVWGSRDPLVRWQTTVSLHVAHPRYYCRVPSLLRMATLQLRPGLVLSWMRPQLLSPP